MTSFRLRPSRRSLARWVARYEITDEELRVVALAKAAQSRGHLRVSEFRAVCRWKSPRSVHHCEKNPDSLVTEATGVALASHAPEIKIAVLKSLCGVDWPTASMILHLCDKRPFPAIDFRALWSLGFDLPPHYSMEFWTSYIQFSRMLCSETGLAIRELDRALWQYSKEMQVRSVSVSRGSLNQRKLRTRAKLDAEA
jgi:hypothetical protein